MADIPHLVSWLADRAMGKYGVCNICSPDNGSHLAWLCLDT